MSTAILRRAAALVLTLLAAAPAAAHARPAGYDSAVAELRRDGRELVRLIAANDAAGFHARLTAEHAQELTREEVETLFAAVHATGPVGTRIGESPMPLDPDTRAYTADHGTATACSRSS